MSAHKNVCEIAVGPNRGRDGEAENAPRARSRFLFRTANVSERRDAFRNLETHAAACWPRNALSHMFPTAGRQRHGRFRRAFGAPAVSAMGWTLAPSAQDVCERTA